MKENYITIGPAPAGEPCAQVGDPEYKQKAVKECERFIKQLKKQFGNPPLGATLTIKGHYHDFGVYHEVACVYFEEFPEAEQYCFKLEAEVPEHWED